MGSRIMAFDLSEYETVEDRLARFWADHPTGRIETAMMAYDGDSCVFRAEIYFDASQATPTATGYAEEARSNNSMMRLSMVEICETSSIGRGLANCDYAKRGKRPSREEMAKVQRAGAGNLAPGSDAPPVASDLITTVGGSKAATPKQIGYMKALAKKLSLDEEGLFNYVQQVLASDAAVPEALTISEANRVIDALKKDTE
jgi:hypothetical protein